ncbi:hypothetical protein [Haloferula sp. BvORR071]|uniref:hypothetical protein n=1 Tax=Haloferula sp. BvORR071 TaxID=1396141 RepID=UPI0005577F45|nr:hypothetical protein [Haloferula sp. BvORR071]
MHLGQDGDWRGFIRPVQIPKSYTCLRWRVVSYLVPWLGTLAALFFLLPPSPDEPQAMELLLTAPLLVALGLAHLVSVGEFPGQLSFWMVVLGLAIHGGFTFFCARLAPLVGLFLLQVVCLGIGVAGAFHLSNLPTGG